MLIRIPIPPELESVIRRLRDDEGLGRALVPAMDRQNQAAIAHISKFRMRGNNKQPWPASMGILGIRTARLWKSLRASQAVATGAHVSSGIGTNVQYAGAHEFGFNGTVQVAPHTRKKTRREVIFGKRRVVRKGDTGVRGHSRKMNMPARAPITRGIQDKAEEYGAAMGEAARRFYEGKTGG
jgi:phage gpG-like protein